MYACVYINNIYVSQELRTETKKFIGYSQREDDGGGIIVQESHV